MILNTQNSKSTLIDKDKSEKDAFIYSASDELKYVGNKYFDNSPGHYKSANIHDQYGG